MLTEEELALKHLCILGIDKVLALLHQLQPKRECSSILMGQSTKFSLFLYELSWQFLHGLLHQIHLWVPTPSTMTARSSWTRWEPLGSPKRKQGSCAVPGLVGSSSSKGCPGAGKYLGTRCSGPLWSQSPSKDRIRLSLVYSPYLELHPLWSTCTYSGSTWIRAIP